MNGSGQTIALVEFDGYLASDIAIYESLAGRTNIPLQNVLIDGFSGVPTGNTGGETMDEFRSTLRSGHNPWLRLSPR